MSVSVAVSKHLESNLVSVQKLRLLLGTALSRLCPTYGKVLFL